MSEERPSGVREGATGSTILDLRVEALVRDGVRVLRDVVWRVRSGEHWAIVGPNGAGKTMLLRILAGYLWPSRGEATVLGRRFGDVDIRDLRRTIGIVSSAVVDWMPGELDARGVVATGFDATVGMPMRAIAEGEWRAADRALEAVGAATVGARPYGVLSQGERQRVMIARALVAGPALLVLDEACGGLDPVARERFLASLARLAATPAGPAIVLVTHHLDEIPAFVTHALALCGGRQIAVGPVEAVLTDTVMSETYGVRCAVGRDRSGRWSLQVEAGAEDRRGYPEPPR